jgi:cellulose synthase/poly-beta-1,6-N-acetylglucosamine synthase-like glycosyltransferase
MVLAIALLAASAAASVPAVWLGLECFAALLPLRRRTLPQSQCRPRVAIVVPAHNEADVIAKSLDSIRPQLVEGDRLIVVADNCTDSTAERAFAHGAHVWPRRDEVRRGKGHAIQHAIERLIEDPPDVVICIDADCIARAGAIDILARAAVHNERPIQAAFIMHEARAAGVLGAVSAFAVLVKNYVRPRGLQRLGLPCLITGSGIAYPWHVLKKVVHPGADIVEDMRYTVDLALAGYAPLPCLEAEVHSQLPSQRDSFISQRTRWEHGHLQVLSAECPRLIKAFFLTGSVSALALALELLVPPLSMFVPLFFLAGAIIIGASASLGAVAPATLWLSSAALFMTGLGFAWHKFGRRILAARQLASIPHYMMTKLPIYTRFFTHRQSAWVRTARDGELAALRVDHAQVPGPIGTPDALPRRVPSEG